MRIKSTLEQKMTLRRVFLLTTTVVLSLTLGLLIFINLADNRNAYAAPVSGDYRSNGSGNWSTVGTWQRYNGSSWVAAAATPNSTNNVITIQSGHTVTVTANVTVDQVLVNSGGFLILNSGITLTLANGSGTDLDVGGTFKSAGTVTINASAALAFQNTGIYQHNFTTTAGTIPTASWSAGSTCEIIGYTTNNTAPAGLQTFYNFKWNCPAQSSDISLAGGLTTVNGDFSIINTGASNFLRMNTAAITLTVGGNFSQSGGNFELIKGNAVSTLNVSGDYTQSGGTFTVADGNNNSTINLSGNMSHTAGTITQAGSSVVTFIFKKAGTQIYTSPGSTVTGNIDYTVNSAAILDLGTSILNGRNFTLSSGGGIVIGSLAGITTSGLEGNIQVSGTRSFSTTADYTYDGVSAQLTGNGLPVTVKNLTINNSNDVTITNTVAVSTKLTFTSGSIITGSNEINVTNNSTSAIAGYSTSNYIVGNLRRSISGTGSYDFPVGTSTNYEVATVNLSSVTGPTNILACFNNVNPIVASLPLTGVLVNNLTIDKMMTYGYWTLTPNLPIITGTYTLSATELVASLVVNSGCSYSLLNRLTSLLPWSSAGIQGPNTQTVVGSAVTAVRSGLTVFGDFSIGYGELLSFTFPTLTSGTAGQVNAVYVFPDACSNVDAWITIMALAGGATLNTIDNYASGNGYDEGWQPFINVPGNTTSSILWKIAFKVAGTSNDTILPWLAISGVDIDAGSGIQEFVEATYPYSYGLSPGSPLIITNNSGTYRATAPTSTGSIANIDTSQHQAMFQINYKDVNYFYYRTGAISTVGSTQTRQNSLYFKSFFSNNLALPVRLMYFDARLRDRQVKLTWSTASESNNSYFTVERSTDGENFQSVCRQPGAINSTRTLYYSATDENPLIGTSYYRLKQTDMDGRFTYSIVKVINRKGNDKISDLEINSISPNPFSETFTINFASSTKEVIHISMLNSAGQVIAQDEIDAVEGFNNYQFANLSELNAGIYFITITCGDQKITKKVIRK